MVAILWRIWIACNVLSVNLIPNFQFLVGYAMIWWGWIAEVGRLLADTLFNSIQDLVVIKKFGFSSCLPRAPHTIEVFPASPSVWNVDGSSVTRMACLSVQVEWQLVWFCLEPTRGWFADLFCNVLGLRLPSMQNSLLLF